MSVLINDLYYGHTCECCGGFENAARQGIVFSPEALAKGLESIYKGLNVRDEIEDHIFRETLRLFNEAASKGFTDSEWPDVPDEFINQIRTNNAIWSAFRVHRMQNDIASKLLDENGQLKKFDRWVEDIKGMTNHYVGPWLRTEYNTAVLRAHQAADWKHFEAEQDVFPHLRWMPTTSPNQDPLHRQYWESKLTLPMNHPFWDEHRPGDRWNCKCTLEQTDEPANDKVIRDFYPVPQQPGLDNNPGKDGKLFSDSHPYITTAYTGAQAAVTSLLQPPKVITKRQKTDQEKQEIRRRWRERYLRAQLPDNLTDAEKDAIAANSYELEQAMNITAGKPMTVDEADKQNANPAYVPQYLIDPAGPYYDAHNRYRHNPNYVQNRDEPNSINCQTCAPAYALRLKGFDITAKPNTKGSKLEYLSKGRAFEVWKNPDGTPAQHDSILDWMSKKGYKQMNPNRYLEFFEEACQDVGVYELSIGWRRGGGHATILQRFPDGTLRYIEPQSDNSKGSGYEFKDVGYLANSGATSAARIHACRGILRVDNKLFDPSFVDIFNK